MIPYGRQSISEEDIAAVVAVLRSDYLTQGSVVPQFEQDVAAYVNADYGVAVNSGTSALHIACLALGLGEGDWLWTSPITFVASANCGLYCGAKIDFVDIDPLTFNMSVSALEVKLKVAEKNGSLPKVVVVVHFAGLSAAMAAIYRLAKHYGFSVIEDACHAIGGIYKEFPVGCCRYSDITVFSFHPVKIITTAEGGMAVTNQAVLAERMNLLRSHGITRDQKMMTHEADGEWYYQQIDLGFNYRMNELQAALGISQLQKISHFLKRRHQVAEDYQQMLQELPVIGQRQPDGIYSAFHLYVIRLQLAAIRLSHQEVFSAMRKAGIGVNLHYIPVHLQPFYQKMGFNRNDFPEAEAYYREAISLPIFPELTAAQFRTTVQVLEQILNS